MEPYITPAIPKLMKMYMYSFAEVDDRQLPANNIQSHFKHNSESNIVPTAGAFGTHLLAKYGKE
jgi:hypothetical protein